MKIMEQTHFTHRAQNTLGFVPCRHCGHKQVQMADQPKKRLFFCLHCGAIDTSIATGQQLIRAPFDPEFMVIKPKVDEARRIIDEAVAQYNPLMCYSLLSGGHDSLVTTHVVCSHPKFYGHRMAQGALRSIVHIDTGIGVKETRQFVQDVCHYYSWPLKVCRAIDYERADGTPDPQIYEELVKQYGFPGPGHHQKMYDRLKGRPLNQLVRRSKQRRSDKIMLLSGVRQSESDRRMGYDHPVDVDGAKVWVNPCFYWSKEDCELYMKTHILPMNDVVRRLCMSGECLCGAFAKPGELEILRAEYPTTAEHIEAIEDEIDFPWRWDEQPPKWWNAHKQGQAFLPGLTPQPKKRQKAHMCTSCQHKSGL